MLEAIGTLVAGVAIAVLVVAVLSSIQVGLGLRLALAAVAGAWVSLAVLVTAATGLTQVTTLLAMFALPFVTVGVLAAASAQVRSALLKIPVPLIIGLNAMRVLGVNFLFLAAAGRLSGPFPFSAGIGDILTGLFALQTARIAARASAGDRRVIVWNAFGMLDLVVAVTLGVISRPGSPIQLIHAGAGSQAIGSLPWSLIPLVLVPTYLIGHGIVFAQIGLARSGRRSLRESSLRSASVPHASPGSG